MASKKDFTALSKTSYRMGIMSCVILLGTAMLVWLNLSVWAPLGLTVVHVLVFYLMAIYGHFTQENLSSEVRTAATSMVSTFGRIVFSAVIIIFGYLNTDKGGVKGFGLLSLVAVVVLVNTALIG
jgi:hypothetical protein